MCYLENSFLALLLLSTVIFTMQQELGYPMITLNCTTDYAIQSRSIHISWLLNYSQPDVFPNYFNKGKRVLRCEAKIKCENGYIHLIDICTDETLRYGWNATNIPINETSCNVTVEYDDVDDYDNVMYSSDEVCSFSDPIKFTVNMHDSLENPTVGDPYEIECKISTNLIINSGLVNFTWIVPNNENIVTDTRTNVTTTTSIGKNHSSTLQFLYLNENDQGSYICHVTLLNDSGFALLELKDASIPAPKVSVTIPSSQKIGSELSVRCDAATARGISSNVEIVWMKNNTAVGKSNSKTRIASTVSNGNVFTSFLNLSYLSENDRSGYTCSVTLLDITISESVELNNVIMPPPNVSVTALSQHIGSPLSLECVVTTVRGITSEVDIVWKINNTKIMKRFDGNVTEERTSYVYYYNGDTNLNASDRNTVYQCQVIINATPLINSTGTITIRPTDTSLSQDDESTSSFMIPTIIIIMVLTGFMGAGIVFGACAYQKKRHQKTQWSKDEDLKYLPAIADFYSAMGKDAPSTCESVGEMQKMAERTKDSMMPTIDEECSSEATDQVKDMQLSDSDKEFDSVSVKTYVTREEMLDQVCGHNTTSRKTRLDKCSISTSDSGIENELDNDSNKSLPSPPPTLSYISYQAAKDMHSNTDEMESPTFHECSNNLNNSQVSRISPAGASSQPTDNSTLLSKFYNAMIKQNSTSDKNDCDVNNGWPVEASLMLHSAASSKTEENGITHNVINANQLQACSGNGTITTVAVGSYVTSHCDDQLVLHSGDKNTPAIPVQGSNVGCYIPSSSNENMHSSQSQLDSSSVGVTTTVENGSYIDHYTASNTNNQSSHPTNGTAPPVKAVSHVDHEAPLSISQSLYPTISPDTVATVQINSHHVSSKSPSHFICKDTSLTGNYVGHCAATYQLSEHHTFTETAATAKNSYDSSAEPVYKDAGSTGYVDYHHAIQPPASPVHTEIITTPKSCVDSHTASNTDQPSSQLISKTTGSYADHFTQYPTTDTTTSLYNGTRVDHRVAISTGQPSLQPTYKGTGSYVDCYAQHFTTDVTASAKGGSFADHPNTLNINETLLHPISVDVAPTVKANQPSSYSTCGGSVSTGSYIDRYTATYLPSAQYAPADTVVPTKDENGANDLSLLPNYKDVSSTGYIDHHAVFDQPPSCITCSKTVTTTTTAHIHHQTTSSTNRPSLHPTYKHTGSYVDRYAQRLTTGAIPSVEDGTHADTQAILSNNQPSSRATSTAIAAPDSDHISLHFNPQSTYKVTGSYIDRYAASNTYQTTTHYTATDSSIASPTTKVRTCDDPHAKYKSSQHPISTANDASVKDRNCAVQHASPLCPIYKDTITTGNYIDCYSALDINHASPHFSGNNASTKTVCMQPLLHDTVLTGSNFSAMKVSLPQPTSYSADTLTTGSYIDHNAVSSTKQPAIPMTTKRSTATYASNQQILDSLSIISLQPTMDESRSNMSSAIGASDQLSGNPTDDSTSALGSYVDCYMASDNDNLFGNPKSSKKNTDKFSSQKDQVSGNPSYMHEDDSCPTQTTGVYLPYTTAIANNITEISGPVPSTTKQVKQKPTDLSSNNAISYGLDGDKSIFGSSTGDDYDASHFGEYVAHDNLEKMIHSSHIKDKDKDITSGQTPKPNSVNGQSTANEGYIDCKYASQQDSVTEQT